MRGSLLQISKFVHTSARFQVYRHLAFQLQKTNDFGTTHPQTPPVPKLDKRSLPPDIRQEIVVLHTQYPAFSPHEIATICFVKFNRKPAPATIKFILASGPKPSTKERRYPRYREIEDGETRRRSVIRLHADGWNAKSIAEYLDVSRKTVHAILRRFAEEQFAGLPDKSHARKQRRKVDISTRKKKLRKGAPIKIK